MQWKKNPIVADGAWGTEMLKAGLTQGDAPELWNFSHPGIVSGIARSYAAAGSKIILTNTFGGSSIKLEHSGVADKMFEINKRGAELTKQAGGGDYLTAGDMGPSGKLVMMGEVSIDDVEDSFARQAEALREGGADLIVLETFIDLIEIKAALKGAIKGGACPVVCSMTFDPMADGTFRTIMGHSPEEAVATLEESGASLIGANCGTGIDAYAELAKTLCSLTELPVWIKANAGLPILVDNKVVYPMSADDYTTFIPSLLDAGVAVIGGCCGTAPEHIEGIVKVLKDFQGRGK